MGRTFSPNGETPTTIDLRSPWALAAKEQAIFIAMAGSHQIWLLIDEQLLGVFAGTGAEALLDGPRTAAAFNQPSDIILDMVNSLSPMPKRARSEPSSWMMVHG